MNTLIIPCAGKSSRFPNMKPKWMLTHPDGELMLQKALPGLNLEIFDRIIITVVKAHCDKYEADIILKQVFEHNDKVELCVLDDFTSSASETIYLTLLKMGVKGSFVIKDSDNFVKINYDKNITNSIVGYNIHIHRDVGNIPAKSFLVVNEQNIIEDIIEKEVVSNIICLGVYAFADVDVFKNAYCELVAKGIVGEMFVSHVISYILSQNKATFECFFADGYEDWGTLKEWRQTQKRYRTYFVDVDGVLMKNRGKYGSINWYNNKEVISENMQKVKQLQDEGGQIVITTSRNEDLRKDLENILAENGIKPYAILMGLNHSQRVVINDFAPTNPYPSAEAISFPRNGIISDYLD